MQRKQRVCTITLPFFRVTILPFPGRRIVPLKARCEWSRRELTRTFSTSSNIGTGRGNVNERVWKRALGYPRYRGHLERPLLCNSVSRSAALPQGFDCLCQAISKVLVGRAEVPDALFDNLLAADSRKGPRDIFHQAFLLLLAHQAVEVAGLHEVVVALVRLPGERAGRSLQPPGPAVCECWLSVTGVPASVVRIFRSAMTESLLRNTIRNDYYLRSDDDRNCQGFFAHFGHRP
jgi:hypothetical protein